MRRLITGTSLALLVASGMLVLESGSALASAPVPDCFSYNSTLYCYGYGGGSTGSYNWTLTQTVDGVTTTSEFAADFIKGACYPEARYTISYSYVSGGVTYDSATSEVICDPNPPL